MKTRVSLKYLVSHCRLINLVFHQILLILFNTLLLFNVKLKKFQTLNLSIKSISSNPSDVKMFPLFDLILLIKTIKDLIQKFFRPMVSLQT